MNRFAAAGLRVLLCAGLVVGLAGCSSATGSTPVPLNLAGTWTVATVSSQGHGSSTGTAALTQAGAGVGVNGMTTLAATIGQINFTQTGTAVTGTIKNSLTNTSFNFTGTISAGNFTLAGIYPLWPEHQRHHYPDGNADDQQCPGELHDLARRELLLPERLRDLFGHEEVAPHKIKGRTSCRRQAPASQFGRLQLRCSQSI